MYGNEDYSTVEPYDKGGKTFRGLSPLGRFIAVIGCLVILGLVNFFSGGNRYFYKGYYYQYTGDLNKAAEAYTKFIEKEPEEADAYFNRGSVYLDLGNYESSINDFTRAIKFNSDDYESLFSRGVAYHLMLRYQDAIRDLKKAIEVNSDYAYAYSSLGAVYLDLKEYDLAIENYDTAYELNEGFASSTHYYKGFCYDEMGEYRQAAENYQLFLDETSPDEYPELMPYIQDAKVRIGELQGY